MSWGGTLTLWMTVVLLILLVVFLSSCATDQGPAQVQTVEVKVPVATPCLKPEQVPQKPVRATAKADADINQMAAAIGAELVARRQYDEEVAPLLAACSALPPPKGTQ
jgi:PBP1b-binding outer membrane lipoprotein LpoB